MSSSSSPYAEYHLLSTTRRDLRYLNLSWNTDTNAGVATPYLLLSYHHERLLDAAQQHGWSLPHDLTLSTLRKLCDAALKTEVDNDSAASESCRIRILLSHAGALSVTATPAASLPIPDPMVASLWLPSAVAQDPPFSSSQLLDIYPDTVPTPSNIFTRTKTTRRDHYDAARVRLAIPAPPTPTPLEVLLYNEDGDITETSIRNIAFIRRSPPRWITPTTSTGCLPGVIRRWLLEQGRIMEANRGELKKDNIVDGEYVLTFNSFEGCRVGRMILQR